MAFERLLSAHPECAEINGTAVKLVLLGGSRNAGDAARVESLRLLAKKLGIEVRFMITKSCIMIDSFVHQSHVQFVVNALYPDMLSWLSRASIGLSTMVDEHFGINVVELMVRISPFI